MTQATKWAETAGTCARSRLCDEVPGHDGGCRWTAGSVTDGARAARWITVAALEGDAVEVAVSAPEGNVTMRLDADSAETLARLVRAATERPRHRAGAKRRG